MMIRNFFFVTAFAMAWASVPAMAAYNDDICKDMIVMVQSKPAHQCYMLVRKKRICGIYDRAEFEAIKIPTEQPRALYIHRRKKFIAPPGAWPILVDRPIRMRLVYVCDDNKDAPIVITATHEFQSPFAVSTYVFTTMPDKASFVLTKGRCNSHGKGGHPSVIKWVLG